mmetsp:Transcript_1479/g.2031  ORF Transcript_1479/g.2031 Transcript_1479/m.2031 type:complete len:172 (-) Transcript_1479:342-857(-)|eukprot:CAMPEP_0184502944 /NCGR_PEP_ID=MMETSP0113_2-20130426/51582_1 /TAXON_ID=91329 /ORGANISM="Norrisiella sphaerica, Strain BC52" /LENGTH=171 /DNA_ID=CAMNT_0026892319 /DNA_START=38 /DNA_END=553 /DNA_ORIENTATION=+
MSEGPDQKVASESGSIKDQLINTSKQFYDGLDKKCSEIGFIKDFADKAKTRPANLGLGAIGAIGLIIVLIIGFNAIVNIACFLYPAYASLKAVAENKDKEQWLTYFMIFGFFSVAESFYPALLTEFAFYALLKLFFLVWCFLPMSMGAQKVYEYGLDRVVKALAPKEGKDE